MLVLAKSIVVIVGIFFLLLGAVALVRPPMASRFLLGFASSALKHYTELFARILVGVSLILVARNSAYSFALSVFGWVLIITTTCLALIPWRFHHRFAQFAVPIALRFLPFIGITALAIGALLLWVIVAGGSV